MKIMQWGALCAVGGALFGCGARDGSDAVPFSETPPFELSLSAQAVEQGQADAFTLPAPPSGLATKTLWATWYFLPISSPVPSGGTPLRALDGSIVGPSLSHRDWCHAAMEGSIAVQHEGGVLQVFNYAGTSIVNTVDCSAYYSHDVSRTKFKLSRGVFGEGVKNYLLRPYRTIATDKSVIPWGTVIYVPQARGEMVTLPDGRRVAHDGYFFAGDTGGLIKGNHIDVFIGVAKTSPFRWIKSTASGTFTAHIVTDSAIVQELTRQATAPLCSGPGQTEAGCLRVDAGSPVRGVAHRFSGLAGAPVSRIVATVDGWKIGDTPVSNGAFSFSYTFSAARIGRKLVVTGYDASGKAVIERESLLDVLPPQ